MLFYISISMSLNLIWFEIALVFGFLLILFCNSNFEIFRFDRVAPWRVGSTKLRFGRKDSPGFEYVDFKTNQLGIYVVVRAILLACVFQKKKKTDLESSIIYEWNICSIFFCILLLRRGCFRSWRRPLCVYICVLNVFSGYLSLKSLIVDCLW